MVRNFYISSRNQPNILTLDKDETAYFTINLDKESDSTIINIPTLFKKFNPFWVKIKKRK